MEKEQSNMERRIDELDYELDTDRDSLFCSLNGANISPNSREKGVYIKNLGDEDNPIEWKVIIKQGAKIGEVFDRIPFGILDKTITGLGATTLEIMSQQRNSIIVVPTKSLAYNKVQSANIANGKNYAFYVGSPYKKITSAVTKVKIKKYIQVNSGWKKKIIAVADSLPIVIDAIMELGINVYQEYFLMVDEIDTMQSDSVYRTRLEAAIDYYFEFDKKNRSAVTATLNQFSNPELALEPKIKTVWEEQPRRNIELVYTNYVDDVAVKLIKDILDQESDDKILVAYNSLDGIINVMDQIGENYKQECGILCSERSNEKIKNYLEDIDNVIDENGYLQKKIVFITCAYFAGIDIQDRCRLFTITSSLQPFTYLSVNRISQIAGRCRNGNISETIIYDIPMKSSVTDFSTIKHFRNTLLQKADKYARFLNDVKDLVATDPDLEIFGEFISSVIDFKAKSKASDTDYGTNIIRQEIFEKKFVPAYFNIDALLERWNLKHTLYQNESNLYRELSKANNVNKRRQLLKKEKHEAATIHDIKANNKALILRKIEEIKPLLLGWYQQSQDSLSFKHIYQEQPKKIQEICDEFKKLCPYYDPENLLNGLGENYSHRSKLRNYVNAAVFLALPNTHPFKAHVFSVFNYDRIERNLGRRNVGVVSLEDKRKGMRFIFLEYFKRNDILDDILADYFSCFFKTRRTGGNDKIIGLNPKELSQPLHLIDEGANLFELFIFPD
jgi:hypothetical protein